MERDALVDVRSGDEWWEAPTNDAGALAQDRTEQIHLGKAFVLAVGVVLVLVTVVTLAQLVQGAFQDLGQVL